MADTASPIVGQSPFGFWSFAEANRDRLGAVDVDGRELTFGEMSDRVNQLSHALRELAPGEEPTVALVASNSVDFMLFVLAAQQIGICYAPISSHLTAAEIGYILADSDAALAFVDPTTTERVLAAGREIGLPADRMITIGEGFGLTTLDEVIAGRPTERPDDRRTAVSMLYTSGTSGRPKGVRPERRDVMPEAAAERAISALERFDIDPVTEVGDGVHINVSPLYHAAPIAYTGLALHLGHTIVIQSRFDAEESLRAIERHRVTWSHVVPTMMKRWLDLDDDVKASIDLSSLRWLLHGAAPCPVDVKRRMIEWVGPIIYEYYASTEAGGTVIKPRDWLEHPGTVGRPWGEAEIRILDEDGEELPTGEHGLIYMRNLRPFQYHKDPDKTQAALHGEFVTVGDYGYVDAEGYLFLLDRRTDLVISGGVNVYPAEVEAMLLEHPGVADAGVIGVPDEDFGQVVRAVVEPRGEWDPDELIAALHEHCERTLGSAKRPRQIVLGEVPRSAAGKVLRRLLREQAESA